MPECAVVNASPLIFLSKAGLIHFLQQAAPDILIPETVAWEIGRRGEEDRTAQTVANTPWLTRVETPLIPPLIQSWDLGPGESAVLAYAVVHRRNPWMDDDPAGLSGCVMTRIARHPAAAIRHGAERPAE